MKLKLYSMAIVFVLLLVGCNTGQDNTGTNDNGNIEPTRYNDNNLNDGINRDQGRGMRPDGTTNINNRNTGDRNNANQGDRYEISREAADRITEEIDEIDQAYVLTTRNNAYVAAVIDDDNRDNNRRNGNNMSGIDRGMNQANDMNNGNRNQNGNGDTELSDDVKEKIADIVQSVDNNIDNVYVTTNPDFADLTNNYMDDFDNGKPVQGFFDQIGNMIERVFPENTR